MSCKIRSAAASDGALLEEIERTCFQDSVWKSADFFRYRSMIAEWNGQVAGFLVVRDVFCGGANELPECEILNVAVLPQYRRLGIGRSLLQSQLSSPGQYWLEVRESNLSARSLYRSLGFREVGIRTHYYSLPTENAIVMRLER